MFCPVLCLLVFIPLLSKIQLCHSLYLLYDFSFSLVLLHILSELAIRLIRFKWLKSHCRKYARVSHYYRNPCPKSPLHLHHSFHSVFCTLRHRQRIEDGEMRAIETVIRQLLLDQVERSRPRLLNIIIIFNYDKQIACSWGSDLYILTIL